MALEWFVSLRYLWAGRKRPVTAFFTTISALGVAVGVMALIVVIAVMSGFEDHLRDRILGVNSHIIVRSLAGEIRDYDQLCQRLERIQAPASGLWGRLLGQKAKVLAASPYVYAQGLLSAPGGTKGVVIRGIDPARASRTIRVSFIQGSFSELKKGKGLPGIILGKELAKTLGVVPGEKVRLLLPGGLATPLGLLPQVEVLRVVGIFDSGMYEFDSSIAFISLAEAQRILGLGEAVHGIELIVSDIFATDRLAREISKVLGYPFVVMDWRQMSRSLFSALKLEKLAMFIILTLIVLVAAFNIVSTLILMVMEKRRDIAILKSMGATDGAVMRIFVLVGLALGGLGTLLGVSGGAGICFLISHYHLIKLPADVYYIDHLPVRMELADVFIIATSAMLISFAATVYPALQAARLNPAKVLRYA